MGDGSSTTPESVSKELKIYGCPITPITSSGVKDIADCQYRQNFEPVYYHTTRGVDHLLTGKAADTAKLPDLPDKTAFDIFKSLPKGSSWLDVGCGSGTFIKQVLTTVNPDLEAYGFDSRKWNREDLPPNLQFGHRQEELPHLILGNIDDLYKTDLGKRNFNIITCAATLRHLPDYWGAILQMGNLLKEHGTLLMSYVPRIAEIRHSENKNSIGYGNPVDDSSGNIIRPEYGFAFPIGYMYNRNIFDADGKILPIHDAIDIINFQNPDFNFYYSVRPQGIADDDCGRIAVVKKTTKPLDLSNMFYCNFPFNPREFPLSYIMAKTESEKKSLREKGFISIQERFDLVNNK